MKNKPNYNEYDNFDDFIKTVQFSSKQWKCFENYVNAESDTCNDRLSSYLAAGYVNNTQTIYRVNQLFATEKFKRLLFLWKKKRTNTIEARQESAIEFVCRKLRLVIDSAEEKNDLTNLNAAIMNYAKIQGLLIDRQINVDIESPLKLDPAIETQAIDAATNLLLNIGDSESSDNDSTDNNDDNDYIDAEFETDEKDDQNSDKTIEKLLTNNQ